METTKNRLSDFSSLAKLHQSGKDFEAGISVFSHCFLTGLVARALLSQMPPSKSKLFPANSEVIAAIHDIGKLNPFFQEKIRRDITLPHHYEHNSYPGLEKSQPQREAQVGYHGAFSYLTLEDYSENIAKAIGCHHGSLQLPEATDSSANSIGGPEWEALREETIKKIEEALGKQLPPSLSKDSLAIVAGLTTVSDWIASGSVFDPYSDTEIKNISQQTIDLAIEKAGFVRPIIRKGLSFEEVFSGYHPNDMQVCMDKIVTEPGIYILEAQMGEGKTEAALYAAYKILSKGEASGIYFAMPTQLTSNKIYERFTPFVDKILDPHDKNRALLIHGKSWMYYTDIGEECRPGYSWFDSRKRSLLAPFGVGTIDQALLGDMHVRHSFVRLFGLANKVVIFDEVHTYDSYTGTILHGLIDCLRKLNCTVIILSATLSALQKKALLGDSESEAEKGLYPLISKSNGISNSFIAPSNYQERTIEVDYEEDNDEAAFKAVREKSLYGEQIIWIENTVDQAQEVFKTLASWCKENRVEIALLHSRFTPNDRSKIEDKWVSIYGKEGKNIRYNTGRILIGTQVIEQSLDLDADFMVTRIAPSDMLLQRAGRLWRHRIPECSRPNSAKPVLMVLAPQQSKVLDNPETAFGESGMVYSPYVLFRTSAIWRQTIRISIPADLRSIIESTYSDNIEQSEIILASKRNLEAEKGKLAKLAYNSMAEIGNPNNDTCSTRYNDIPTCPVLLLKKISCNQTGAITLLDNTKIILSDQLTTTEKKKNAVRILDNNIIQCASSKAPANCKCDLLDLVGKFIFISANQNEQLRIGIVDESGCISSPNGIENEKYELKYNNLIGYQTKRRS